MSLVSRVIVVLPVDSVIGVPCQRSLDQGGHKEDWRSEVKARADQLDCHAPWSTSILVRLKSKETKKKET
jgi:hypothetical protein